VPELNYQGKSEAFVNLGSQIRAVLDEVRAADDVWGDRIDAAEQKG
jgi:hypothetical protein